MSRGPILAAALLGGALLASPASAQDGDRPSPGCRNDGVTYAVGELSCIAVCHQPRRLARCDMVLNNTSWTFVSESCPSAMIVDPPWPSDWSEAPAATAMSPIPAAATYSALPSEMPPLLAAFLD